MGRWSLQWKISGMTKKYLIDEEEKYLIDEEEVYLQNVQVNEIREVRNLK